MSFFPTRRLFSAFANRAVVYANHGDPTAVLTALTYRPLPPPTKNTVNVRFLLAPINPADINVIEGVYPAKPDSRRDLAPSGLGSIESPVFVGGNEGVAQVAEVGEGVQGLKEGDWVIMTRPQVGTWCTSRNVEEDDVEKVPRVEGLSQVHAATMTVNPPTAYNMLQDYLHLEEGDWVVQNGANSAVGQAVIQIAASRGLNTLNFVRPRDNLQDLVKQLEGLGATKVLTYDALSDKSLRKEIKEWTGGKDIRLGLNCVGGPETTQMARLLGNDAHLVSYGAMSKLPLSLPTSLFIFKNLTCHGFWQSQWYKNSVRGDRVRVMQILANLMSQGKLKEPAHEIVSISLKDSDETASRKVRDAIAKTIGGRQGKKILLRFDTS
ncbi:hypothetical protein C0993_005840 [Termitomyces sp. T159_Od127]|nr:hypothetical protein C0993_005840 [Termitomyces sp. T159_Od127]